MPDSTRFKVNEIFFSLQGEGRGPIRDRAKRGAGAPSSGRCDLGVVGGAVAGPLRKRKPKAQRERKHSACRCAIGGHPGSRP